MLNRLVGVYHNANVQPNQNCRAWDLWRRANPQDEQPSLKETQILRKTYHLWVSGLTSWHLNLLYLGGQRSSQCASSLTMTEVESSSRQTHKSCNPSNTATEFSCHPVCPHKKSMYRKAFWRLVVLPWLCPELFFVQSDCPLAFFEPSRGAGWCLSVYRVFGIFERAACVFLEYLVFIILSTSKRLGK